MGECCWGGANCFPGASFLLLGAVVCGLYFSVATFDTHFDALGGHGRPAAAVVRRGLIVRLVVRRLRRRLVVILGSRALKLIGSPG